MRIKQLCNRKVRDFAMALRARKVSGAFEKRPLVHGTAASKVQLTTAHGQLHRS